MDMFCFYRRVLDPKYINCINDLARLQVTTTSKTKTSTTNKQTSKQTNKQANKQTKR